MPSDARCRDARSAHWILPSQPGESAEVGIGRVELCRANALLPADLDRASTWLGNVTSAYESGNQRIREVAAEAYGMQALVILGGPDGNTEAARRTAAERYRMAAGAAVDEERRGEFQAFEEQVLKLNSE
jgi:hypothetical protein